MNILVAYDGSEGARAALAVAADIATQARAHVLVVHAINPLTAALSVFAQTPKEALDIAIEGAKAHIAKELGAFPGVEAEPWIEELERGEDVAAGLLRIASGSGADFIATGSRRAGTIQGALLGSVAATLIRDSARPVIVVHPTLRSACPEGFAWPLD